MAKKTKRMAWERLQKEVRYLSISIPYDSREEYCLLEFSNSEDGELEKKDNHTIPMLDRKNFIFNLEIDLTACRVQDWKPEYGYWRIWGKVKKHGTYTLLDSNKQPLWQIHGNVPCKLVPPFKKGWGDYLDICVNSDGSIKDFAIVSLFSAETLVDAESCEESLKGIEMLRTELPTSKYKDDPEIKKLIDGAEEIIRRDLEEFKKEQLDASRLI